MTDKELAGMRRRAGDMACKFSGRTVLRLIAHIDALTAELAEARNNRCQGHVWSGHPLTCENCGSVPERLKPHMYTTEGGDDE